MQIRYLKGLIHNPNIGILNLIRKREEESVRDDLGLYFFHYNPQSKNLSSEFSRMGLPERISSSNHFYEFVRNEADKYISNSSGYCPFSVCFALRIKIEEYLYAKLNDPQKEYGFISTHGTGNKIDYCESIGLETPEIFSLLGIIYNDKLHWHDNYNIAVPLAIKLENKTIKKMIESVFEMT